MSESAGNFSWTESGDEGSEGTWHQMSNGSHSTSPPSRKSVPSIRQRNKRDPANAGNTAHSHGNPPRPPEPEAIDPRFNPPYIPPATSGRLPDVQQPYTTYNNPYVPQQPPFNRPPKPNTINVNKPMLPTQPHVSSMAQQPPAGRRHTFTNPAMNPGPTMYTPPSQAQPGYWPAAVDPTHMSAPLPPSAGGLHQNPLRDQRMPMRQGKSGQESLKAPRTLPSKMQPVMPNATRQPTLPGKHQSHFVPDNVEPAVKPPVQNTRVHGHRPAVIKPDVDSAPSPAYPEHSAQAVQTGLNAPLPQGLKPPEKPEAMKRSPEKQPLTKLAAASQQPKLPAAAVQQAIPLPAPLAVPMPELSQYSSPAPSVFKEGVEPEVVIDLKGSSPKPFKTPSRYVPPGNASGSPALHNAQAAQQSKTQPQELHTPNLGPPKPKPPSSSPQYLYVPHGARHEEDLPMTPPPPPPVFGDGKNHPMPPSHSHLLEPSKPYTTQIDQPPSTTDSLAGMHLPSPSTFKAELHKQPKPNNSPSPKPAAQAFAPDAVSPITPLVHPLGVSRPAKQPKPFVTPDPFGDNLPIPVNELKEPGPFMSGALQPPSPPRSSQQNTRPPEPEVIDPRFDTIIAADPLPPPPPPVPPASVLPSNAGASAKLEETPKAQSGKERQRIFGPPGAIAIPFNSQTPPVNDTQPLLHATAGMQAVTPGFTQPVQTRPPPGQQTPPGKQKPTLQAPVLVSLQQSQKPPSKPAASKVQKQVNAGMPHFVDTPIVIPDPAPPRSQAVDVRDMTEQAIANGWNPPSAPPPPRRAPSIPPKAENLQKVQPVNMHKDKLVAQMPPMQPNGTGQAQQPANLHRPKRSPAEGHGRTASNKGVPQGNVVNASGGGKQPPPPPPPRGPGAGFFEPGSENNGRKDSIGAKGSRQPSLHRCKPTASNSYEDEDVQSDGLSQESVPTVPFLPSGRIHNSGEQRNLKHSRRRQARSRSHRLAERAESPVGLSSLSSTEDVPGKSRRVRRYDLEASSPHRKRGQVLSSSSSSDSHPYQPREYSRRSSAAHPEHRRQADGPRYPDERNNSIEPPKVSRQHRKPSQRPVFVRRVKKYIEPDGGVIVYREPAKIVCPEAAGHHRESIHRQPHANAPSRRNSRAPVKVVYEGSAPVRLGIAGLFGGNK